MSKVKNGVLKMGKIASWLIPIGMLILAGLFFFLPVNKEEKPENPERTVFVQNRKDAIAEFGNARFLILRAYDKDEKKAYWELYDNIKYTVESRVYNFKEIAPYVYAVGKNGYTKLNYQTAEITQNEDLAMFSKEDQEIFKELEKTKDSVIIK